MVNFRTPEIQKILSGSNYSSTIKEINGELIFLPTKNSFKSAWSRDFKIVSLHALSELNPFDFSPDEWMLVNQPNILYVITTPTNQDANSCMVKLNKYHHEPKNDTLNKYNVIKISDNTLIMRWDSEND